MAEHSVGRASPDLPRPPHPAVCFGLLSDPGLLDEMRVHAASLRIHSQMWRGQIAVRLRHFPDLPCSRIREEEGSGGRFSAF